MAAEGVQYEIGQSAYLKLILHALKHPSAAVNGVLIGSAAPLAITETKVGSSARNASGSDITGSNILIEDAIPFFHSHIGLAPMTEVALSLVDEYCSGGGRAAGAQTTIVGYYHANERNDDLDFGGAKVKIADGIARNFPSACCLLVDNERLTEVLQSGRGGPAVRLHVQDSGKGWRVGGAQSSLMLREPAVNGILKDYLAEGRHMQVVDFEDHLADITKDWTNPHLLK